MRRAQDAHRPHRRARRLGETLGWKAGLWRLRQGKSASDVVLRGLQSGDLNVLIDGQPSYSACPNRMDPAAFHVDLAEVDRVEVALGSFAAKNQGGAGGFFSGVRVTVSRRTVFARACGLLRARRGVE